MALFASMAAAEQRCRQQVAAKVWVVAHVAGSFTGAIIARFQRFLSPTARDEGAWKETTQDNVN